MPALVSIVPGANAQSTDVQQLIDLLQGNRNAPIAVYVSDPVSYALALKNADAGGKGLIVYDADGVTALIDAHHGTIVLLKPTVGDFTNAQHAHVDAASGGAINALSAKQAEGYAMQANY